jgi:DNA-binding SARP family transcriptional activator
MSVSRYAARICLLVVAALTVLCVLALLWQLRPPQLPQVQLSWSALTEPMSITEVEEIGFFVGWLVLLVLMLVIAWGLLDEIAGTVGERHEEALDAFAARVLPRPQPRERRPARLAPPGKIPFTFDPRPEAQTNAAAPSAIPTAVRREQAPAPPAVPASQAIVAKDDRTPSISILGPLQITGARPRRGRMRTATAQLLAYLVLRPTGATGEELIEAIWPGQDPSKTKPRLWQSAADARKVIGEAFIRDGERYQLDRAQLKIDLDELERLLAGAQNADAADEQRLLEDALDLFRGEPLAGADCPWADADIRHLNARLVDLLGRTGQARLTHGDPHGALQAAERGLALDEFNESLWRLALQAEHALGMRESVTRRYRELTRTLDEQLGLQPSQETRTIYRQLLGQT